MSAQRLAATPSPSSDRLGSCRRRCCSRVPQPRLLPEHPAPCPAPSLLLAHRLFTPRCPRLGPDPALPALLKHRFPTAPSVLPPVLSLLKSPGGRSQPGSWCQLVTLCRGCATVGHGAAVGRRDGQEPRLCQAPAVLGMWGMLRQELQPRGYHRPWQPWHRERPGTGLGGGNAGCMASSLFRVPQFGWH